MTVNFFTVVTKLQAPLNPSVFVSNLSFKGLISMADYLLVVQRWIAPAPSPYPLNVVLEEIDAQGNYQGNTPSLQTAVYNRDQCGFWVDTGARVIFFPGAELPAVSRCGRWHARPQFLGCDVEG